MSIEAMKQALEYLDSPSSKLWPAGTQYNIITSVRQAIEQAEKQEPMAFKIYKPTPPRGAIPNVRDAELPWVYDQDPSSGNVASMWVTPVKNTPQPQREWVGLTDTDIGDEYVRFQIQGGFNRFEYAARAIEAKLKEKNTP